MLLAGLTIVFLIAVVTLVGLASWHAQPPSVPVLIALFVTLIPTTIGGLLSAIASPAWTAGALQRNRHLGRASRRRATTTRCSDKTGTITFGNRMADAFAPSGGRRSASSPRRRSCRHSPTRRRKAARSSSWRPRGSASRRRTRGRSFVPFAAQTRISGVDLGARRIRKGAVDSVLKTIDGAPPAEFLAAVERIARTGGTPLAVSENGRLLGVIHLKDVVKPGIKERFAQLRAMGIRTVMVTGDNRVTRGRHRDRGGRRRLHRGSHAAGQAELHPRGADGRPARRDVRRRHPTTRPR